MLFFNSNQDGNIVCMETVTINGLRIQTVFDDGFFCYRNPRDTKAHKHLNYELYFVECGTCTTWCAGKTYLSSAGDCFLTPANIEHNVEHLSNDASIYSFRFSFSQLDITDKSLFLSDMQNFLKQPLKLERNFYILELIKQLRWELSCLMPLCAERIQSILILIYTEFFRCLIRSELTAPPREPFSITFDFSSPNMLSNYQKEPPREFYMDILDDFFTHHLTEKTTLKDLANHLHFSVSQTQRLIKNYYGISFQQKLIKTKIEQSKRLIATTDLSLEEISKQVGYSSYNAFFDAFVSQTGQTPSDYRLSLQK